MLTTCGACLLGRKIMVPLNNLNTPVQVIHKSCKQKLHIYNKRTINLNISIHAI
jgi:hypothetical protein